MANPDFNDGLMAREIEIMEIYLWANAARSAITIEEYVRTRILAGTSPEIIRQELLTDLKAGGRIFGEFTKAISATANGIMARTRDIAQIDEHGLDQPFRWVAVIDKRTCPDCDVRHNKVKMWDDWEAEGLPRTGATICRHFCRCVLTPEDAPVVEPVKRERPKK